MLPERELRRQLQNVGLMYAPCLQEDLIRLPRHPYTVETKRQSLNTIESEYNSNLSRKRNDDEEKKRPNLQRTHHSLFVFVSVIYSSDLFLRTREAFLRRKKFSCYSPYSVGILSISLRWTKYFFDPILFLKREEVPSVSASLFSITAIAFADASSPMHSFSHWTDRESLSFPWRVKS